MTSWIKGAIFVWTCFATGCAVESSEQPGQRQLDNSASQPESLAPSCERLDDLGSAANGEPIQVDTPAADRALCVSIQGSEIDTIAGRACRLVEPQGFSLVGCADWYDCGGCFFLLRRATKGGEWTLEGLSPECDDSFGKYSLSQGIACDSEPYGG